MSNFPQLVDSSSASSLFIGSARAAITPPVGTPLGGNVRADNYATGVLQDLYVRALWAQADGTAVCVLSLDLLGLWESDANRLREAVGQALGIPATHVLAACTHTHSGPDTLRMFTLSDEKEARDEALLRPWFERMEAQVVAAARRARDRAERAFMRLTFVDNPEIARNRRLLLKTGETCMNWHLPPPDTVERPLGFIDPRVTVATFHAAQHVVGALVHFTCHPAILAGLNLQISGDYCGLAMSRLERTFAKDSDASFLFLNGALGNVNHIDYRHPERGRGADEVERCADSLAGSVEDALYFIETAEPEEAFVSVRTHDLLLPLRDVDPEQVQSALQTLARHDGRSLDLADGVPPEVNARRILRLEEARRSGRYPGPFASLRDGQMVVPLQMIQIGPMRLAAVPGEPFVEYGHAFKRLTADPSSLIVSLANGYVGYLPTPEAFPQGGYEPSLGPCVLQPDAAEQILARLLEMAG